MLYRGFVFLCGSSPTHYNSTYKIAGDHSTNFSRYFYVLLQQACNKIENRSNACLVLIIRYTQLKEYLLNMNQRTD